MKAIGRTHRTETEIATSILPRIAFEHGHGMSTLDEPFSGPLVDASNGHGKRGGSHEITCFTSTEVDPGDDVDIVVGKAVTGIPVNMKECILKAGCIPAGEELFGISRIIPSPLPPRARGSASLRSSKPPSLRNEP